MNLNMAQARENPGVFLLRYTTPIMFVVLFLYFGVQAPNFFEPGSILNIIKQASFTGIAAVGLTFVLLTAGIDLSVGSIMYLAPLIAITAMRQLGIGTVPALFVALGMGVLLGGINAFCVVSLRIIPFIVTLSTLFLFRGAGTFLTESRAIDIPEGALNLGLVNVLGIPLPVILFLLVVMLAHIALTQTPYGRKVYAVGNDIDAAKKAGINTNVIIASVYIISGVCAALAGFVIISQIGRLDTAFGEEREFTVIAAAVLGGASLFGGRGNAFGAVVGAVLIQMVNAGLVFTGVNLYLQPMIQGAIIFLAVFFDSLRDTNLQKLKRRSIRTES